MVKNFTLWQKTGDFIKILYLITRSDTIGGAQTHVKDLAFKMSELGHEVTVVVGGTGVFYKILKENEAIKVVALESLQRDISMSSDLATIKELIVLFRELSPDIITIHSSKAGVLGRVAAFYLKIPTTFTAHGWSFTDDIHFAKRCVFALIEMFLAAICQHVIVVSRKDRCLAKTFRVCGDRKMSVIHNGAIDLAKWPKSRCDLKVKFISVARFAEPKDHLLMIKAFGLLPDRNWALQLVGDGPFEKRCKRLVEELGLVDNVEFLGLREDVQALLAEADVFLLISKSEGLPISIIEALSSGLPVIGSNVGGIPELISDRLNGLLVKKGDVQALSNAAGFFLFNPEQLKKMSRAARATYEESFTFNSQFEATFAIYQRLANVR